MKTIIISVFVVLILITGAFMFSQDKKDNVPTVKDEPINLNNVSIVDGKQIIEIRVRGGYNPHESLAKAGIPTAIRFITKNTFDCSSFIRIPSLNISKALPQTGSTDIDIGIPKAGVLDGVCGMGMYSFDIKFE